MTSNDRCRRCYACVRACPVKALAIEDDSVVVKQEMCVGCGSCVRACKQGAKTYMSQWKRGLELARSGVATVILAPSFPGSYPETDPLKVIGALRELGFSQVWDASWGAEIVMSEYSKVIDEDGSHKLHVGSMCPSAVRMVQRFYPSLTPNLMKIASPMVAASRAAWATGAQHVVFVGPCPAKKAEGRWTESQSIAGLPDLVLTFAELDEMFKGAGVDLSASEASAPDVFSDNAFRLLPLPMGMVQEATWESSVSGSQDTIELLDALSAGLAGVEFADVSMCRGCIAGVGYPHGDSLWSRRRAVERYAQMDLSAGLVPPRTPVNLAVEYSPDPLNLAVPSDEEIAEILQRTGKYGREDELDCGACGFATCRDKAVAVARGLAEVDMCLPFLLKRQSEELSRITLLARELDSVVEAIHEAIYVCNIDGLVTRANPACAALMGAAQVDIVGMELSHIVQDLYPDVASRALGEKRRVTAVREAASGRRILVTSSPVLDGGAQCAGVVTSLRDITELIHEKMVNPKARSFIPSIEPQDMVAYSHPMEELLTLVNKVANVASTVLITGESGVGKEVVARYIHRTGNRASAPFVKINCAAIPETLLESELFGYEEGAFTGAKRQGKPGLMELAGSGTLLLDEITEMPLSLQAKLLQVIQEKRVVRVGGTKPIRVGARIVAATNRDVQQEVAGGRFRADLYYRLNVIPIVVPPLRERLEDIAPLTYHFLRKFNERYGCERRISSEARKELEAHKWPGNVRELENIVEFLVVTVDDDIILPSHLPPHIRYGSPVGDREIHVSGLIPLRDAVEELERQLLDLASRSCESTYAMARALGVNQSTVVRKLQRYSDR